MQRKLLGIISVDLNVTVQHVIKYIALVNYLRKVGIKCSNVKCLWTSRTMIQLEGTS